MVKVDLSIDAVKNFFLKMRNAFPYKKSDIQAQRLTVNYADTKQVGVLFSSSLSEDHKALEQFVTALENDGKKVTVLVFEPTPVREVLAEVPEGGYQYFSFKDISLVGKVRHESVNAFSTTKFDYLCCVTQTMHPIFAHILRVADTSCRIGNYTLLPASADLFEMMIDSSPQNNLSKAFEDILFYWRNISRN